MTLVSLLAALALVLGAVGVYGVISHYVVRRSREYGIRIALGQQPFLVVRQVVGRGIGLVALGSAIGLAGAVGASRLLVSLLYGVQPTDPLAMAGAVAVLLAVGMLAAFVPARRASLTIRHRAAAAVRRSKMYCRSRASAASEPRERSGASGAPRASV